MPLHGPVGGLVFDNAAINRSRGIGLVVADLLVNAKEVVSLVIVLIRVLEAGIVLAIVLDPLPLSLRRAEGNTVG